MSANDRHMEEHAHALTASVFLCPLMYLQLKYMQIVTSAFQTEEVKCFSSEDVWRGGAEGSQESNLSQFAIGSHL